uniref:Glycosyltransferase n=1 Tax=Erysipelothrix rhusiopathiae TaxID=1648 RepID=A0A6S6I145_ERYRH|nr:glycosyltransferase [Erysipelothrix rhusiopathiae]
MNSGERMMRYLFAINTLNVGGAETGLVELINELVAENEIDLFLTYKTGPLLKKLDSRVNIISMIDPEKTVSNIVGLVEFGLTIFGSSLGYRHCFNKDYDVEVSYLEGFPALLISRSRKNSIKIASIRVEIKNHKTLLDRLPWGKKMQASMYNKFDGIHCVSTATKNDFDEIFPASAQRSYVITTGFDIDKIHKRAILTNPFNHTNEKNLVLVGRMEDQKGYDKVFEAVSLLGELNEPYKIHIIGNKETKYAKKLITKYDELLNKGLIVLHGQVSNPYPYIYYGDALISSSNYEGFPRVINESLALKKLVIATDIPSNAEALHNGVYGYQVTNDVEGIMKGIKLVVEEPDKLSFETHSVKTLTEFKDEFINKISMIGGRI